MALVKRPEWESIPEPAPPDTSQTTAFQALAAEHMAQLDDADAGITPDAVTAAQHVLDGDAAMESLGVDVAAGATQLQDMIAEADPDTLITEVAAAGEQDAAIDQAIQDSQPATT